MLSRIQKSVIDSMKVFMDKSVKSKKVSSTVFFDTFMNAVIPRVRNFGRVQLKGRPTSLVEAVNPLVDDENNEDQKGNEASVYPSPITMTSKITTPKFSEQSIDFPEDAIVQPRTADLHGKNGMTPGFPHEMFQR